MIEFKRWRILAMLACTLGVGQVSVAKEPPILIDLTVTGTMDTPGFEPLQLNFHTAQEYVLVITNDKPYSIVFHCGKFGQQISTYLLQGTPNVNQESITLMPTSKVTWHFIPQQEGQFKFYASIPGANQAGKAGEILIKNLSNDPTQSSHAQPWVTAKDPAEVGNKPQKKALFSWFKKNKAPPTA